MRTELAKIENTRGTFTGTFIRFGTKKGYRHKETTVLLSDVRNDTGEVITSHLWFNYTKEFKRLWEVKELRTGKIIQFLARVKPYTKGYRKDDYDYRLSHPTKLSILEKVDSGWITEPNTDPPFKYLKEYFNYSHDYNKLYTSTYTTIRGIEAMEYYELNQIIEARLSYHKRHSAQIIEMETLFLDEMDLAFLKADTEYPGFVLNSKSDFIDLINSFRKTKKSHITEEQNPNFAVFRFIKLSDLKTIEPETKAKPKPKTLDSFFGG